MTRFWRNGFYRSSALGTTHWVEGHWVERDIWDQYSISYHSILASYQADERATARYVNPNAKCPVCGDPVFFYQNEFGSRVYFDELGPPWPKHPCTDHSASALRPKGMGRKRLEPALRSADEARLIARSLKHSVINPVAQFKRAYRHMPWRPYRVAGRFRVQGANLLVLAAATEEDSRFKYIYATRLPAPIKRGTLVYLGRGRVSYFDLRKMKPREIKVTAIGKAVDFVSLLVGKDGA